MTILLSIDFFASMFWILEWYTYTLSMELKVKAYGDYCLQTIIEEKEQEQQQKKATLTLVKSPVMENEQSETKQVTTPDLGEAVTEMLNELIVDLGLENQNESKEEEVQVASSPLDNEDDYYVAFSIEEEEEDHQEFYYVEEEPEVVPDEDCIQLADLLATDQTVSPTSYDQFASAKIADDVAGAQQWVATVVGMEESYIHISDGKRIWVNVGEQAASLNIGDVLKLDVIRNGREVKVENLFLLEAGTSADYFIPDDHNSFQCEYDEYAAAM